TTIQKFMPDEKGGDHPLLTERRNVVVIADEAHRSQYDFIDGFARHMRDALPHATYVGFTGTPIETGDKNTLQVFGDCIDVYDVVQHFERRRAALPGKAMVVCMSRRICVALYKAIVALRPDWHADTDDKGEVKIVFTGSAADREEFQPHLRTKRELDGIAQRF